MGSWKLSKSSYLVRDVFKMRRMLPIDAKMQGPGGMCGGQPRVENNPALGTFDHPIDASSSFESYVPAVFLGISRSDHHVAITKLACLSHCDAVRRNDGVIPGFLKVRDVPPVFFNRLMAKMSSLYNYNAFSASS